MSAVNPDLPITSRSTEAADACRLAMANYAQRKIDVVPQIMSAQEHDPECAMSWALLGLMLHGAKNKSLKPKVVDALDKARLYSAPVSNGSQSSANHLSDREQHYINALSAAVDGQYLQMVECYKSILSENPTDTFAVALAQNELFWLGEMPLAQELSASLEPHWNEAVPGYSDFLACRAFDLEETHHFDAAEKAGRLAVETNADNAWGAHAIAHVLLMRGRFEEGVRWIDSLSANWDDINQIKFHLWWHKCLFHLERGEHDAVLDVYDNWIRNTGHSLTQAMPDLYIDLQNGASLLWRLEHVGVNVGDRWQEMAQQVLNRVDDVSNPFTSAHFAAIMAAVGDEKACDDLIENMQSFSQESTHSLAPRYVDAGLPAARAAIAHRRGDFTAVIEELLPKRHLLWQMGGSHAQQDFFFQMLIDAAYKSKRGDLVAELLDEREKTGFTEPARRVAYEHAAAIAN